MTQIERFKAVCRGDKPDYVPIFGFPGSPGMSLGCMRKTHERLVAGGMPEWVDGSASLDKETKTEHWRRYWGTTGPIVPYFTLAESGREIQSERRIEDEFEIIEYETGAITRQVIDNDVTYSMPDFRVFHVRDRKSWEFYRDRTTPGPLWPEEKIEQQCREFENRDRPLAISGGTTWGFFVRSIMGPERALTALYDDPSLVHEMIEWNTWRIKTYTFPLIERLRPEIISCGEDNCYNHGMLISPAHFREFCSPFYRQLGDLAGDCEMDMLALDSDGNVMELAPLVEECGVNCLHPLEVKAGNDLFKLRREHPQLILMGGLEKEVVNEGNGHLIEKEILSKVPPLLAQGRYFPNGDHGIQPLVNFENMCKFMTLLHEVTGNPEGEFPRIEP